MRRSEDRILTTHTGSLPRPPELTRLYVRRARGGSRSIRPSSRGSAEAALRGIVRQAGQTPASTSATTASSSARASSSTSATG